ncbi:helix-turn-helix transcriptional regulator [Sphaerimonospora thailandensis]|nr:helix-turn-helix transcriptional regulator [Sphaerimonospora thailandensis]
MTLTDPTRLRQAMTGKHNVTTLAKEIGRSRGFLVMILGGKRTCSQETATAIATALDIPADHLFRPALSAKSSATERK